MIDLCSFSSLLFCGHILNENFLSFISQVGVAGECAQAHAGSMLLAFFIIFVIIKIMPPSDEMVVYKPFLSFYINICTGISCCRIVCSKNINVKKQKSHTHMFAFCCGFVALVCGGRMK